MDFHCFFIPYIDSAEYVYEGKLSLVDGKFSTTPITRSNSEGTLKVYLNGKWTFVCNETFGDDEAESSCKQLGYTRHITYDTQIDVSGYVHYVHDMINVVKINMHFIIGTFLIFMVFMNCREIKF